MQCFSHCFTLNNWNSSVYYCQYGLTYFILLLIMQYYNYLIPTLAIRTSFRLVPTSFWDFSPFFFFYHFFLFWHQRCSRIMSHGPCPSSFFKEPLFLLLKKYRVQDLGTGMLTVPEVSLLLGIPRRQSEEIHLCKITHAHTYISVIIYVYM